MTAVPGRRALLRATMMTGLGAMTGAHLADCSSPAGQEGERQTTFPGSSATTPGRRRVLLAYFSRPGENYYYGGRTTLQVGNTEVLARKISSFIRCDVHRIEAADPYPRNYDETVRRNVREQNDDARPTIKGRRPSLDGYDTVLLGSPIWNVRAPMIMTTFTEQLDFRSKTVVPFTTHAMSGLGTTARDYARSCRGATIAQGLAVRGEEVADADTDVTTWLRDLGLTRS
ncbi:flavodoxin [Streptomyces sp. NPDC056479]|uniref:flavodoxin n=1 Tax=Streptomyces sp. NPDC056479 TaxID=3345832 RepID=UPI0036CDF167